MRQVAAGMSVLLWGCGGVDSNSPTQPDCSTEPCPVGQWCMGIDECRDVDGARATAQIQAAVNETVVDGDGTLPDLVLSLFVGDEEIDRSQAFRDVRSTEESLSMLGTSFLVCMPIRFSKSTFVGVYEVDGNDEYVVRRGEMFEDPGTRAVGTAMIFPAGLGVEPAMDTFGRLAESPNVPLTDEDDNVVGSVNLEFFQEPSCQ